jgi:hypothetical protein
MLRPDHAADVADEESFFEPELVSEVLEDELDDVSDDEDEEDDDDEDSFDEVTDDELEELRLSVL